MTTFNVQVSQNPYLAQNVDEVHAVVSISSTQPVGAAAQGSARAGGKLAEAVIVDASGSMGGEKIRCAIAALESAIQLLHDDAMFCVIAGSEVARLIVPLSPATPGNRIAACREVRKLTPTGGTAMSTWLAAAGRELQKAPEAIHHALL